MKSSTLWILILSITCTVTLTSQVLPVYIWNKVEVNKVQSFLKKCVCFFSIPKYQQQKNIIKESFDWRELISSQLHNGTL